MKTWYAIADMIGLFVLMVIMATIYKRIDIYDQEYNSVRLSKSVEYSTSAAFEDSLAKTTAAIDYSDLSQVRISTIKTMDTFDDMMCFNYNLARTEESKASVEETVRGGILAAKDGFYVLSMQDDSADGKDGAERLTWSPKLPYTGTYGRDSAGKPRTIAFELGTGDCAYRMVDSNGTYAKKDRTDLDYTSALGISRKNLDKLRKKSVSESITNALTYSVDNNDRVRGDLDADAYIPSDQTISGINSIKTPSILFVVQGGGYTGKVAHENVAFTGLKVIPRTRIIGYYDRLDGNKKKYAYERQGVLETMITVGGEKINRYFSGDSENPTEYPVFSSPEDAAKKGYVPDYDHIFRAISYDFG